MGVVQLLSSELTAIIGIVHLSNAIKIIMECFYYSVSVVATGINNSKIINLMVY